MRAAASIPGARVLLIAPDDAARAGFVRSLGAAGLSEVDVEADLDRALARAAGAATERHDCVIVDHRHGATALELVRALRARDATAPILLLATRPDEDLERVATAAGVTDVLTGDDLGPARLARRIGLAVQVGRTDAETARLIAQAQTAAAARDDLLANVSHDLRSPLNAIVLACDALEAAPGEVERRRYIAAVRRGGQRAERLLRDLLDVSRIESGALRLERRPLSARALLEQTRADHELLAGEVGSTIALEVDTDPGQVFADRDRVLQVLANLVGNSIKHAPGTAIALGARPDGDAVELVIQDHGPGIKPESLPHVFDRFWQGRARRRGGAGLGLAIARGIVEAHGGAIAVASELGKGTRFTVRLPRPHDRP
jgi:signal transduction histidine kinase